VLWDINEKALQAVGKQIATDGGYCWTFVCDVTARNDVYRTAERVLREVGRVDILINNAGIVSGDFITEIPDSKIVRTFEVNILAHFWTVKAFLPEMVKNNSGHVVTIASAAGLGGLAKMTDYCASKWAAIGFDESLRLEMNKRGLNGVKTTCICPYYIDTGMFDGVETRFSFLLPILKENYAAAKILDAVLTDRPFLIMPRLLYLCSLLRFLLPVGAFDWVNGLLGINSSMDHFRGRSAGASPTPNPQVAGNNAS